jgi:hypothetical protein
MSVQAILDEVERLPVAEKWELVSHVLQSLQRQQLASTEERMDWHQFLRATYGSIKDESFKRWDQGEYEEREPIEMNAKL